MGGASFRETKHFCLPFTFRLSKHTGMTLEAYLKRPDALSLSQLAAEIGVSKGRMSQLRKAREWPAELALTAEAKTDGALSASSLSPVVARARQTGAAA